MRIAILTNEYPPHVYGGAGVHVEYLTRELAALDDGAHTVRVLCFGDQHERGPSLEVDGVRAPVDLPAGDPRHGKFFQTLLQNLVMSGTLEGADIVHCHTWYAHFAGCLVKQLHGIPLVLTTHSLEPHRPWKVEQLGTAYHASRSVGMLMEDLGVLDGEYSEALDINGAGIIVGWSRVGGFTHAFVWRPGEGMIDLTPGAIASTANAINEDGDIVGWIYDPFLFNRAVIWRATGVVVDLNDTLPPSSGWTVAYATDINDHGQIVGYGRYASAGDYDRSFLLTPTDCLADLTGDGVLNVFDFLAFQTAFSDEHPRADMAPTYGVFNVFDFLAFQTAFGDGC